MTPKEYEERLIRKITKRTSGIETSKIENIIVNLFLPLGLLGEIGKESPCSTRELYSRNILGYKRLLKVYEKNNSILPERIKKGYMSVPCGVAKILALTVRPYIPSL